MNWSLLYVRVLQKIYNADKEGNETCMSFLMDTHGVGLITLETSILFLVITGNYS